MCCPSAELVRVNGQEDRQIKAVAELPRESFRLTGVAL